MTDLRQQLQHSFRGRPCLVGIGSVDQGDDALGVRLAEAVLRAFRPGRQPGTLGGRAGTVILAGTTPERHLLHWLDGGYDHVLFLDAVDFGGLPGTALWLSAEEAQSRFPQVSTHKLSIGMLARQIEASGLTRASLLGVQPGSCRFGDALSAGVRNTVKALATLLVEAARDAGLRLDQDPRPGTRKALRRGLKRALLEV